MGSKPAEKPRAEKPPETVKIQGQVVDAQGAAVGGAHVWAGLHDAEPIDVRADAQGKFTIDLPTTHTEVTAIIASDQTRIGIGAARAVREYAAAVEAGKTPQPAELRITLGETKQLKVSLTGADSQPVAGARTGLLVMILGPLSPAQPDAETNLQQAYYQAEEMELPPAQTDAEGHATLLAPANADTATVYAYKPGQGFDYRCLKTRDAEKSRDWPADSRVALQLGVTRKMSIHAREPDGKPIAGLGLHLFVLEKPGEPDSFNLSFTSAIYRAATDAAGDAHFDDLPAWDGPLMFWPESDEFPRERITWDPAKKPKGNVKVTLARLVPISGKVELPDGQPASGITVTVCGEDGSPDDFRSEAATDETGKFEIAVAPDRAYLLAVVDDKWGAAAIDGLVVQPGKPVTGLAFKLRPATRIAGRVVAGPNRRPVVGQDIMLLQYGRNSRELGRAGLLLERDGHPFRPTIQRNSITDSEGRYEFRVGPGKFDLHGPSADNVSRGMGIFDVADQTEMTFDITAPQPVPQPESDE